MLLSEARWIGENIEKISIPPGTNILDLGGESWLFRNFRQPWIGHYIFGRLEKKGAVILHTDIELDVCSPDFVKKSRKLGSFGLVFACNLLEHVSDYKIAAANIAAIIPEGGFLIVSVPRVFPYHPNPIDNGFRPSTGDLKRLFPDFKIIARKIVTQFEPIGINRQTIVSIGKTYRASCLVLRRD